MLDSGAGTGSTGWLAAREVGRVGCVVLLDLSAELLLRAREKIEREDLQQRTAFLTGDLVRLPFADEVFDVVLSTYSLCPVYDPRNAALELYRVTRPGGKIAVAHSTDPANPVTRRLANIVESIAREVFLAFDGMPIRQRASATAGDRWRAATVEGNWFPIVALSRFRHRKTGKLKAPWSGGRDMGNSGAERCIQRGIATN